ncbi:hypothetical protein [Pseudomonas sp.]|jgi:hypothetical protein|uniref:hypothetical protein n=1 Tax=Pseudomonas sp. TaxID=306 RepID=UPI0028ADC30D|nr:hypothetical protein [Pseudomonas sp.]
MSDTQTPTDGMKPCSMYRIFDPADGSYWDGHFLGGIYYENYQQMGRITGDTFFYDGKDEDGQLSFRDGIAGNITAGLKMQLRGGMVFLDLVEVV